MIELVAPSVEDALITMGITAHNTDMERVLRAVHAVIFQHEDPREVSRRAGLTSLMCQPLRHTIRHFNRLAPFEELQVWRAAIQFFTALNLCRPVPIGFLRFYAAISLVNAIQTGLCTLHLLHRGQQS